MLRVRSFRVLLINILLDYEHGSVLLKHPSLYEFRDKSDKIPMYNRKFESSMDRANRIEDENSKAILERLVFDENEPRKKHHLRAREILNEI